MQSIRNICFILLFLMVSNLDAQVLNVPSIIQQEDEWCWSACSDCILQFFGDTVGGDTSLSQCTIAEYTRSVDTTSTYGSVPCCQSPNGDCNSPNDLYNRSGSVQDILEHFKGIKSTGFNSDIDFDSIKVQIKKGAPFIIRWGWYLDGELFGGHFLVGYGIIDSNIYYMNPLEGLEIGDYNWIVYDSDIHLWNYSLQLDTISTSGISPVTSTNSLQIFPNPTNDVLNVSFSNNLNENQTQIEVVDMLGETRYNKNFTISNGTLQQKIDLSYLPNGVYILKVNSGDESQQREVVIAR